MNETFKPDIPKSNDFESSKMIKHTEHAVEQSLVRIKAHIKMLELYIYGIQLFVEPLTQMVNAMSKSLQDLNDEEATLDARIDAYKIERDVTAQALTDHVAQLQAQIDAGNIPTDFQPQVDALQAMVAKLGAPVVVPATPPTPPAA